MDIAALRKTRNNNFAKITSEFEKIVNPPSTGFADDTRYWKLEKDKAGNASAIIRFLPTLEGDELPWVRIFNHGFQGPTGKWYIENSLSTFNENDPVGELNSKLWNSGNDADKKIAQARKRRLQYTSNILVISDPKHPENEGKVFLYKYGKKIFDMLMDKARPTFEDETPVNVFDLWEGANFRLRMRQVDGWPSYDKSEFESPSELFGGDEDKILSVVNSQYKLSELLDRKYFKSYEELSRKLNSVLNTEGESVISASQLANKTVEAPTFKSEPAPSFESKPVPAATADDDDIMSYFQSIADED